MVSSCEDLRLSDIRAFFFRNFTNLHMPMKDLYEIVINIFELLRDIMLDGGKLRFRIAFEIYEIILDPLICISVPKHSPAPGRHKFYRTYTWL